MARRWPRAVTDNSIILWDVANAPAPGRTPHRPLDGCVNSVAFSPDGKTLASGSEDTSIILWDVSIDAPSSLGEPLTGHTSCGEQRGLQPGWQDAGLGQLRQDIILWDVSSRRASVWANPSPAIRQV